jgi:hypothetical protein
MTRKSLGRSRDCLNEGWVRVGSRKRCGRSLIDFVISKCWWWNGSRKSQGESLFDDVGSRSRVGRVRDDSACRTTVALGTREMGGGTIFVAESTRPLVWGTVVHAAGSTALATPAAASLAVGLGVVVVGVVIVIVGASVTVVGGAVVVVVVVVGTGVAVFPTRLPARRVGAPPRLGGSRCADPSRIWPFLCQRKLPSFSGRPGCGRGRDLGYTPFGLDIGRPSGMRMRRRRACARRLDLGECGKKMRLEWEDVGLKLTKGGG